MKDKKGMTRRSFFAGLGLLAAAGAALKVSHGTSTDHAVESPTADPGGDGYRLTEHIKKYYRSTVL